MAKAKREVNVLIKARDEATRKLQQTAQKAREVETRKRSQATLDRTQLDILRAQVDAGDEQARTQLEIERINQRTGRTRRQLLKIQRSEQASTSQKRRATQQLVDLERQRVRLVEQARTASQQEARSRQQQVGTQQRGRGGIIAQAGGGQAMIDLLAGGGLVGGASMLAQKLTETVDKAGELADEFQRGEASVADVAGGIAKALPFMGQLVTLGESLRKELDGGFGIIRQSTGSLERQAELQEEQVEKRQRLLDMLNEQRNELALMEADGEFERERLREEQSYQDELAAIREQAAEVDRSARAAFEKQLKDQAEQMHEHRLADIRRREAEAGAATVEEAMSAHQKAVDQERERLAGEEANREQLAKARAAEVEQAMQAHRQAVQQERERDQELADVRHQIRQHELREQGEHLEAQRMQIKRSYQQRIRDAEDAGRDEMAALLRTRRDQELEAAGDGGAGGRGGQQAGRRRGGGGSITVGSRTLGHVAEDFDPMARIEQRMAEQAKNEKQQAEHQKQLVRLMGQMLEQQRRGGGGVQLARGRF